MRPSNGLPILNNEGAEKLLTLDGSLETPKKCPSGKYGNAKQTGELGTGKIPQKAGDLRENLVGASSPTKKAGSPGEEKKS